jgi:hypothetical protein
MRADMTYLQDGDYFYFWNVVHNLCDEIGNVVGQGLHSLIILYYRVDDMFVDDLQLTFLLTGLRYQSQL